MNEETVSTSTQAKPKKKHSFWFLKLLLILVVFAGGVVLGLKLYTMPGPSEMLNRYLPSLQTTLNPNAKAQTAEAAPETTAVTPAPSLTPAPTAAHAETEAPAPTEKPAETEAPAETPAPEEQETEAVIGGADAPTGIQAAAPAEEKLKPIGMDAALTAALKRADVKEKDAEVYGVYPTENNGLAVYQVDFAAEGTEYMYLVDLFSGEIVGFKTVRAAESYSGKVPTDVFDGMVPDDIAESADYISAEEAARAAISHAGVRSSLVEDVTTELQRQGSSVWYEVDFKAGSTSYSYRVSATDGAILQHEKTK